MRAALITLLAVLAFASPAFAASDVTVDNTTPTNAAGARTVYAVAFTLTNPVTGTAQMEVTFPAGTAFGGYLSNTQVIDTTNGNDVGVCFSPANGRIQCQVDAGITLPIGRRVSIRFRGVTNPVTPGTPTVSVQTTGDPAPAVSPSFTVATAGQLTAVAVGNATPTRAAGARTNYTVAFTLSGSGRLMGDANSGFFVTFPADTTFAGLAGNPEVVDMTTNQDVGNCFSPNNLTIQCYVDAGASIPAGRQVEIRFRGITNTTTVATNHTASVYTTSDPGAVPSAAFTTVTPGQVSAVTVDNLTPTRVAGARTNYTVGLTLSGTGTLSGSANSRINVTFPNTTTFAGMSGNPEVVDMTTNQDVGNCFSADGLGIECYLDAAASIPGGRRVEVRFRGINNPTTVSTNHTATVSTTSDPADVPSAGFTTIVPGQLTAVTVDNATPTRAAGGRTNYTVGFTLSADGTLSGSANSRINVTFPNTTTFAGMSGNPEVVDMTTNQDVGNCFSASGFAIECYLDAAASIPGGRRVEVRFRGITNTTAVATNHTVTVSTTSDPGAIPSAGFTTTTAGQVTAVAVDNSTPTRAAGGRTNYTVGFTLSGTGTLSGAANSRIYVTFPTNTTFAGMSGNAEVVDMTNSQDVGNCFSASGLGIECYLDSDKTIAGSGRVEIRFRGITNTTTVSTTLTAGVSTTSDPSAIASSGFTTTTRQALTGVTVGLSNTAAASNSTYVIGFTLSASGTLAGSANSRIDITFPAGTTFASLTGNATVVDVSTGQDVGNCFSPSGLVIQCYLDTPATIPFGRTVRISFTGITNPTATGEKQLTVATTSDLPAGGNYQIGQPEPLDTTLLTGPAGPTNDTTPTFTFTGNSDLFECRVDAAPFANCTSPYTSLALTPGAHTFEVRSVTAAGNDPTPAARTFEIDTTPPAAPAVVSGPDGATTDTAPAFAFIADGTTECRIDDAPFQECASPYKAPALAAGAHVFEVRARDAAGNVATSSRAFTVTVPQQQTPTPSPSPTPTPEQTPVPNRSVVGELVSGTVLICQSAGVKCVPLKPEQSIPVGSVVDTKKGRIELKAIPKAGAPVETAVFYDGIFKVTQKNGITDLALVEPLVACGKAKASAGKKVKKRKLWGNGKGAFRTTGKYSAATVRGTQWLVEDSCAGTLTKVTQGVVSVRDNVKKKTILVTKSYTARPKR